MISKASRKYMINKLDSKSPTENVGQGLTGPGEAGAGALGSC